jgi:uncharacterized membrane protein
MLPEAIAGPDCKSEKCPLSGDIVRLPSAFGVYNNRRWTLKQFRKSVVQPLVVGFLFLVPVYLAILLLLKAMKSLGKLVQPIVRLLPESVPGEALISLLAVVMPCIFVGLLLGTKLGRAMRTRLETSVFQKIPGYELVRSMTRQLAGQGEESEWQPVLAEIEEALVPAFIVEELHDGRFAVFVPSVPTPLAGAIYILTAERVHPVNVPFAHAIKVITRWGSGSSELVNAMQERRVPSLGLK